jgi:hypothetical protein
MTQPIAMTLVGRHGIVKSHSYVLRNAPQNTTRIEECEVPHAPGLILWLPYFDFEELRYRQGLFMPCIDVFNKQMHLVIGSVLLAVEIL